MKLRSSKYSILSPGILLVWRVSPPMKVTTPWELTEIDTPTEVLDEALVLNSLQKPRKISILGTDGRVYSLLCKPKDDLRKDQRLMEFNNMINGFLKKDVDSTKRRMCMCYQMSRAQSRPFDWGFADIKTYAVTPLNEECGLIEWVDNLRTLRDIVMKLLRERGITPNVSLYVLESFEGQRADLDFANSSTRFVSTSTKHAPVMRNFRFSQW